MRHATLSCLLAILAGVWLAGCSVEPKMTDKHTLYIDNWTKRNNPEVYVEPQKAPPVPVSALIVPFQVTQDIPYGQDLGEQLTRVVWQTWTRDRVFPKLLYEANLKNGAGSKPFYHVFGVVKIDGKDFLVKSSDAGEFNKGQAEKMMKTILGLQKKAA